MTRLRRPAPTPSRAAARAAGSASMRYRNSGLTSRRRTANSMPSSKRAVGAALLIEVEQHLEVFGRDRAAEGAPRQAAQDGLRAARFLRRRLRIAREQPSPARRIARPGGVVGPDDGDGGDRGHLPGRAARAGRGVRILKWLAHLLDEVERTPVERDADLVRTAGDRHANRRFLARCQREHLHLRAVQRDFELLRLGARRCGRWSPRS